MNEEEYKAKIVELEGKITTLTKENEDYKAGSTEFDKQIKEKEETIAKLKEDAKNQGLNFKKLRDMTEAEKELLTEKEKELMERQEAQEEALKKFQDDQTNFTKKQKDALIDTLAMKKAGGNKELADKIKITLNKINGIDNLTTEAELMPEIEFAFNGLGIQTKTDPLNEAHNTGGGTGEYTPDGSYAETTEGKSLAGALGLSQAQPDAGNNK